VLVGLFLALLELIRDKLIWAEQSASTIYLRALTDEPAEQAVQKAILEVEAGGEFTQAEQPPIPIAELPAQRKPAIRIDAPQQQQTPVPIVEYSPEGKSSATTGEKVEIEDKNHNPLDDSDDSDAQ
jgi:hypothetical protein